MQDHHKFASKIIFFLIILFIAWIISGGPQRAVQTGSSSNKFIQLNGYGSGNLYNHLDAAPDAKQQNVFQDDPTAQPAQ